jgi:uncharacterized membrane protein YciS (DUF1049 family)
MNSWWLTLSPLEHVYLIIALIATTVLLIQLILAFISGVEFHSGSDIAAHHGDISEPHFQLLTIRNIVAFFAVFSWSGLAFHQHHFSTTLTVIFSFICGLVMMIIVSSIFYLLFKLQSDGTIKDTEVIKAVGQTAVVYLPISNTIMGKINITLQGRQIEINAITKDSVLIPTGSLVKVLQVINNQALVERISV